MSALLEPGFEDQRGEAVGSWMPTRYTPTLTGSEDFTTQGDKLLRFVGRHWSVSEVARFVLDQWQHWLVRHVLEVYPDDWPVEHLRGQLRYRQVVISMGRQNGKSLLGAMFVLYFLCLHVRGPRVIGLASIDRQAQVVYNRVRYGIDHSPELRAVIKTTKQHGISRRDGAGDYFRLPNDEDSAQGEPGSGIVYDELHLGKMSVWDAMLLAMRARRNALLIGITTAGDDASDLLARLYAEGASAIEGADERFGFFVWEGASDELTEANVIAANPAIACGRVPLDVAMHDARKMWVAGRGPDGITGRQRVIRYTLNRFIAGAGDAWASVASWRQGQRDWVEHGDGADVIYAVERTQSWESVAITATSKYEHGYLTELAASVNGATHDQIVSACKLLAARDGQRAVFAIPTRQLKAVGTELIEAGLEVVRLGDADTQAAAQTAYGLIAKHVVHHPGDQLLTVQMPRGRRRTTGENWRLSWSLSLGDIDAVLATCYGLHVADTRGDHVMQLF